MTALKKIRIGTDVITALSVNISGKPVTWSEGDIRHVYAFSDIQGQPVAEMAHKAEGQTLRCTYAAKDQNYTGPFRVIVEFADGKAFSSSLDVPAFEIVRTTEEADADTGEVVLDIDGTMRFYTERLRKWSETLKKYFPDGLKSAGSAFDEITPTKAVKRIKAIVLDETTTIDSVDVSGDYAKFMILSEVTDEEREGFASAPFYYKYNGGFYYDVWAIGFASRTSLIGCVPKSVASNITELRAFLKKLKDEGNPLTILYQLVSDKCEEYTYDELNLTEQVSEGGTEEAIITEGKTSTPLRADIVYPIDAYNTIKANKANIGTLSSLNTASKTDLVSAINELAGKVAALEANATEVTNETTE